MNNQFCLSYEAFVSYLNTIWCANGQPVLYSRYSRLLLIPDR